MKNYIKWLGVGLGFTIGGPIGAVLGFALGSILGSSSMTDFTKDQKSQNRKKMKSKASATPGDFEISLLILSSLVIKADEKVDERELEFVRLHFVKMYGKSKANKAFKLFNKIIKEKVSAKKVSIQIRENMEHASRLQLVHFLFGIAKADENVSDSEEKEIKKIASYLYINGKDYASIKAMFYDEVESAFKILEINEDATNDEVKSAYRKMAKKHHPDRVQNVGEDHLKDVNEKFQKIHEAYETIKEERSF